MVTTATTADQQRGSRLATICALLVVSTFVAGKAARDAILLSRFSIESFPQFIALAAALALPMILLAGKLMQRWGPMRLVPAMNVVSAALSLAEWALLDSYPRPIAIVVFVHLSTVSALLVSGFWSIVNERFDIQTAKRHIGRIGLGATLGGIVGGVVAERSAVYLPPDAILLVLAGLQVVCAVMLYRFGRGHVIVPPHAVPTGVWSGLGVVSRSRLLQLVATIVVLGAVAAGVMDYVFKANIVAASSRDGLLRALAAFYTVTNVVTAVVQVAVCGPVIAKLGVPRSVATLPVTVTVFGVLALAVPGAASAAIARAAELITRNSFYRAGYELLYAPLPEEHKRPAKVVLDVGADKLGDIFGAQLVALIVYAAVDARTVLLVAALVVGAVTVVIARRLPRTYTKALEESLISRAAEVMSEAPAAAAQPEPWVTLSGVPQFGEVGDVVPLRLRSRRRRAAAAPDRVVQAITELRSGDVARIHRELANPVSLAQAAIVIELVERDEVARAALDALAQLAPKCTGLLVDAILNPELTPRLRGRLATIVAHGEPQHAAWGLWRGLEDPEYQVRYRCGAALSQLAADGHFSLADRDQVFDAVRRELLAEPSAWAAAEDEIARERAGGDAADAVMSSGLEHVFRVLGLALPAEPLRIALHAMRTDDIALRATALEYLEAILPADVRAKLWPLLEEAPDEGAAAAVADAVPALAARARETPPPVVEDSPPPALLPLPPPPKRSPEQLAAHLRTAFAKLTGVAR